MVRAGCRSGALPALACLAAVPLSGVSAAAKAEPFAELRAAYHSHDAIAAAAAYAPDAEVVYRYDGWPEERHRGTQDIASSFRAMFARIDPATPIDLNFRQTRREGNRAQGFYRLRIGKAHVSYGRFDVKLDSQGRFLRDVSRSATREDFEAAAGAVMLAADEETLERGYYAGMAGRYRMEDGCTLVVTRSIVRLFVRNTCTNEWRGLSRRSGMVWTAGDRVRSDRTLVTYRFAPSSDGISPTVEVLEGKHRRIAKRLVTYTKEDVRFRSADGIKLTGTLYKPSGPASRAPATVMLHGSGPQDRDGYASIIAVMADEMATAGRAVLTYDKRGSGDSGGDGERAGFPTLAEDARAAMAYLATRQDIDQTRIGLAGSSQAGWVAARAIADGAPAADVFLLGAAGTALTVTEQNLYNTEVRMRCAGISEDDIQLALDQQATFFTFLRDPTSSERLNELTRQGRARPALADWLFPDAGSTDRSAGAWYVVLDPAFDPLPIWQSYRGKAVFLFSEFDDATPTDRAIKRLASTHAESRIIPRAQHLGLEADNLCKAELTDLSRFAQDLPKALAEFAAPSAMR